VKGWGGTWRAANDAELFTFVNVKVLLFAMSLDMSKNIALFEGSRASCVRLSDNNGVDMKMSVEHWWNVTREKRSTGRKTCPSGTMPAEVRLGHVFFQSTSASSCLYASTRYYAENAELYS
jgi:hypothetical protein